MIISKEELKSKIKISGKRLLGIDWGTSRIGIALSDKGNTLASPLMQISGKDFAKAAKEINVIVKKEEAGGVIIGFPLEMSGKEGKAAQEVRKFANILDKTLKNIPIAFFDERLSSKAVETAMQKGSMPIKKQKQMLDQMSAAWTLQGFLDGL
jgi:putative Holliday junction resolvase